MTAESSREVDSGGAREMATFGGGCFWCLEAVFEQMKGVEKVVSGYAGGDVENPTYHQVCEGITGHAEVVQVTFDPNVLSYEQLLDVFFAMHDPTTLNRQGADIGTQYRSVIFYHTPAQKQRAEEMIARLGGSGKWPRPLVTEVVALERFYPAEDYHQGYFRQHHDQPYCQVVIAPKVSKLRKEYSDRLES